MMVAMTIIVSIVGDVPYQGKPHLLKVLLNRKATEVSAGVGILQLILLIMIIKHNICDSCDSGGVNDVVFSKF